MNPSTTLLIGLTVFSFITRISNLTYPGEITWDEIYYIARVQNELKGLPIFIDHPPFGKLIILPAVLIFGDNAFGWRITQAIIGSLLVPLSYCLGKKFFNHKYAGLLSAFFISFETILVTYSRIGLIDIFLLFFAGISILFFMSAIEKNKFSYIFFFLSAISTGLTISIKWIGLVLLPIYLLWLLNKSNLKNALISNLLLKFIFLLIALLIYTSTFLGEGTNFKFYKEKFNAKTSNFIESVISWNKLAKSSHSRGNMTHPDTSKWYTWPFMYKPVWLHFKVIDNTEKKATCISTFGNPIIWWLGFLALIYEMYMVKIKKDKTMIFLIGSYLICFLPFALIKRPMFVYHYLLPLFFLVFILEHAIISLYNEKKLPTYFIPALVLVTAFAFFYFYPFVNASPVSFEQYHHRLWLESWKFTIGGWTWK